MADKFFRRRGTFKAIQFDGTNIEDVRGICGSRIYYLHEKDHYVVTNHGIEMELREGDYVMCEKGDSFDVLNQDVFETLYEEVTK